MTDIREHVQGLDLGEDITLYEIDLTEWGLDYIRLFHGDEGASTISFGGLSYSPWPIKTSGWKFSGGGSLPRPRFALANVNRVLTPMVRQADGFRYAPIRRIRTYARYLDYLENGDPNPDADGTQHKPVEVFEFSRITLEGEIDGVDVIQWELRAPIDRPNAKLPRIVLVRENCQHSYRVWNETTETFDYTGVTCPYAGANGSFDENGDPVTDANDECPRLLRACKLRFGANAVLPFLAFPSMERVKLR